MKLADLSKYRVSEALMITYRLIWDDFYSWYLEIIKPNYGNPIDKTTYNKTIEHLEKLLKLLHPFTPFLSEEMNLIGNKKNDIIISDLLISNDIDENIIDDFKIVSEVVSSIRNFRKESQVPKKI